MKTTHTCVTGLGSLPLRDPEAAIKFVARYAPQMPFVPQLPNYSKRELMLNQILYGLEGAFTLDGDRPEPKAGARRLVSALTNRPAPLEHHSKTWKLFLEAARAGRFANASALKMQLCGPATLAASLALNGESFAENHALFEAVVIRITNVIAHVAPLLRELHPRVIIQLDEPMLEHTPKIARDGLWQCIVAIHEAVCESMVHCCARLENGRLLECGADILSFDVYSYPPTTERIAGLKRHLEKGRQIAWGVVPTVRKPSLYEVRTRASRWWMELGGGELLAQQSLITASCGLAMADGHSPEKSFLLCRDLAETMGG
ncbi:hypothetical protein IT570_06480 [Candidatus Sumerlaeota bacterium]|nr:hypothetical protein [Candidatus Sumerlaeota bacterium]